MSKTVSHHLCKPQAYKDGRSDPQLAQTSTDSKETMKSSEEIFNRNAGTAYHNNEYHGQQLTDKSLSSMNVTPNFETQRKNQNPDEHKHEQAPCKHRFCLARY